MKIHISFRLSEEAIRLIKLLAEKKGVSQASIIELAIREMAKKEGMK
ncbi:MAG: ribbon-helix-helix protein, CopG family [Burkholderiales bacterium]